MFRFSALRTLVIALIVLNLGVGVPKSNATLPPIMDGGGGTSGSAITGNYFADIIITSAFGTVITVFRNKVRDGLTYLGRKVSPFDFDSLDKVHKDDMVYRLSANDTNPHLAEPTLLYSDILDSRMKLKPGYKGVFENDHILFEEKSGFERVKELFKKLFSRGVEVTGFVLHTVCGDSNSIVRVTFLNDRNYDSRTRTLIDLDDDEIKGHSAYDPAYWVLEQGGKVLTVEGTHQLIDLSVGHKSVAPKEPTKARSDKGQDIMPVQKDPTFVSIAQRKALVKFLTGGEKVVLDRVDSVRAVSDAVSEKGYFVLTYSEDFVQDLEGGQVEVRLDDVVPTLAPLVDGKHRMFVVVEMPLAQFEMILRAKER